MIQPHHRVTLQPAFILHGRDFRDTSRLLDVFTQDYGRVSLVAKGARSSRSKLHGLLQPFTPLIISWSGKGEVQTLTGAESKKNTIQILGKSVMSAYYMNELVQRLVTQHDPHPELFELYQHTLSYFSTDDDELVLRRFEKNLLNDIGYGLNLALDASTNEPIQAKNIYYYDIEKGPININNILDTEVLKLSGQTLIDLENEQFTTVQSKKEAKQLMRIILSYHLGDKPLKTRNLQWYKTL